MTWKQKWMIESDSRPGFFYTVAQKETGEYACSCLGWTRNVKRFCSVCHLYIPKRDHVCPEHPDAPVHTERIECKHIRAVLRGAGMTVVDAVIAKMRGWKIKELANV